MTAREDPPPPCDATAHLEKQPELHMTPLLLTSPCSENWDLGRIKAEYFNLAPEFTWLCQSNYLALQEKCNYGNSATHLQTGKKGL